ncbi:MAG TPA: FG-GAP-like repeat-containing protein [Terriglobales bacterium]
MRCSKDCHIRLSGFGTVLLWLVALTVASANTVNPVPLLNQPLVPDVAVPGGTSFTLTIAGTGFVSGSVVNWNGAPLSTEFVSSERLSATVPASDIGVSGTATVTVVNPGPGGGSSNVVTLETSPATSSVFFSGPSMTVGNSPLSEATGDFEDDGKLDLATTNYSDATVSILPGKGDGTFGAPTTYSVGGGPYAVVVGDFNGDSRLDLAIANSVSNTVSVLLGNGDGTFQPHTDYPVGGAPLSVVTADFNGDGKLDLAVANSYGNTISVLLGNGDGTFQPQVAYGTATDPTSLAVGDFNADGKLDLAAADFGSNAASVLLGNGDGTFGGHTEYSAGSFPISIATEDLNGDGNLDLVLANSGNGSSAGSVSVLLGKGNGTFQVHVDYPTGELSTSLTLGDLNGDNRLDLAVSNLDTEDISILLGNGDGTFQATISQPLGSIPAWGITSGDFNADGRLDLVVGSDNASTVSVLLQTAAVLSPTSATFGNQAVGTTSPPQTVVLSNNGRTSFTLETITVTGTNPGDFGQTNDCGNILAPGASCTINVTFAPTVYGERSASLSVTDSALGSPQVVPLSGFGEAPVAALTPTSLTFAQQAVGTGSAVQRVTLSDSGDVTLNISGIALAGANASDFLERNNCPGSLVPNRSCTISLKFGPQSAGKRSAQISVTDNAAGSPQFVWLTGTGTFFELSPTSLNLGDEKVGTTSSPQTVTLTNVATVSQPVFGIRIRGTYSQNFAETNSCGSSIPGKSSCTINVTFTPRSTGVKEASLEVDGGGGAPLAVLLLGTGTN